MQATLQVPDCGSKRSVEFRYSTHFRHSFIEIKNASLWFKIEKKYSANCTNSNRLVCHKINHNYKQESNLQPSQAAAAVASITYYVYVYYYEAPTEQMFNNPYTKLLGGRTQFCKTLTHNSTCLMKIDRNRRLLNWLYCTLGDILF